MALKSSSWEVLKSCNEFLDMCVCKCCFRLLFEACSKVFKLAALLVALGRRRSYVGEQFLGLLLFQTGFPSRACLRWRLLTHATNHLLVPVPWATVVMIHPSLFSLWYSDSLGALLGEWWNKNLTNE